MSYNEVPFSDLWGKTVTAITGGPGDDYLEFVTSSGDVYKMYHYQDCCESVTIDDISGELTDLIGYPIIRAEENSNEDQPPPAEDGDREWRDDSFTWTFYRLQTARGLVVIRWYGSSNGYYSQRVSFVKKERN